MQERRGEWRVIGKEYGVSSWDEEKLPEMDTAVGCTPEVSILHATEIVHLKRVKMAHLCFIYLTQLKKRNEVE